jgi:predicted ArsR family transcriptional regulator
MDFFDECVLEALKDGKPRDFEQILGIVDFSHNTLRLHLGNYVEMDLIVKDKMPSKGHGRPKFMYTVPSKVRRQLPHLLSEDYVEIIHLPFDRLQSICKYEKGGYCKKIKGRCEAQNCPQILK